MDGMERGKDERGWNEEKEGVVQAAGQARSLVAPLERSTWQSSRREEGLVRAGRGQVHALRLYDVFRCDSTAGTLRKEMERK